MEPLYIPFTEILSLVNDDRITESPQTKHMYLEKKKKSLGEWTIPWLFI